MPNISWIQIPSPLKTCHTLDHSFCRLGTVSIFPTFNWIGSPFPTFRFAALSTNVSIRFTSRLRSDEFFHHKFNTHHNRFRSTRTWSRLHRRLQRRLWRRVLHRSRTGRHGIKSVDNNWHTAVRGRSRRKVRIATKPRCWHVCFVSSGIHSDNFEQQDDDDDWHCWYEYVLQRMILQYSFYDDSRESHPPSSVWLRRMDRLKQRLNLPTPILALVSFFQPSGYLWFVFEKHVPYILLCMFRRSSAAVESVDVER